jgi:hypothetical protein
VSAARQRAKSVLERVAAVTGDAIDLDGAGATITVYG